MKPLSLRTINNIVAMIGKNAGIENPNPRYKNITPHLFRHSLARNWKREGGSLETLQKILGHESFQTTMDLYGTQSIKETEFNYRELSDKLVKN
jgi:integrase